ncbi:unnamed protein product [Caenorhabditis brenneri]
MEQSMIQIMEKSAKKLAEVGKEAFNELQDMESGVSKGLSGLGHALKDSMQSYIRQWNWSSIHTVFVVMMISMFLIGFGYGTYTAKMNEKKKEKKRNGTVDVEAIHFAGGDDDDV